MVLSRPTTMPMPPRGPEDRIRRVTGTADVPLNAEGRRQGRELAHAVKGKFTKVVTSPMQRSSEMATMISPEARISHALGPMRLGQHEGRPVDTETRTIQQRMRHAPDEPAPGRSEHSGLKGESLNDFADRVVGHVQKQQAQKSSNDTILNVTHGRNMRAVNAWAKKGMPADRSIDMKEMLKDGDWSGPAELHHLTTEGLKKVAQPVPGGIHYARHGETSWTQARGTS